MPLWLLAALEAVSGFFKTIPIIERYFPPKTATEKENDAIRKRRDQEAEYKKTGRPPK